MTSSPFLQLTGVVTRYLSPICRAAQLLVFSEMWSLDIHPLTVNDTGQHLQLTPVLYGELTADVPNDLVEVAARRCGVCNQQTDGLLGVNDEDGTDLAD